MRSSTLKKFIDRLYACSVAASLSILTIPLSVGPARAMDTDIFNARGTAGAAPNVLIVLDNTSNWARSNQDWPGGIVQGQSEVDAIKTAINNLPGSINVGLLEYVTGGPATDDGGYVRFAVSPMGQAQGADATTNRNNFSSVLTTIYDNINAPNEKTSKNVSYGNLMYDAHNYFAGATPFALSSSVVSSLADSRGYTSNYTKFKSPLSAATSCGNSYIIFIGNTASSGPKTDSSANTTALANLGGNTTQMKLPVYSETEITRSTALGYSSSCYTSAPTGTPTDYAAQCSGDDSAYDDCSFSSTDRVNTLATCPTGQTRYSVVSTVPGSTTTGTPVTSTSTITGTTTFFYAQKENVPSSDKVLSCPGNTIEESGGVTTKTNYTCGTVTVGSAGTPGTETVGAETAGVVPTKTALSNSCYSKVGNGSGQWSKNGPDYGTDMACPSSATTPFTTGQPSTSTTTNYTCEYEGQLSSNATGCTGSNKKVTVTRTGTSKSKITTKNYKFDLSRTVTKTVTTSTTSASVSTPLGNTFACYRSQPSGTPTDFACRTGETCTYSTPTTTGGFCPSGYRYQVLGNFESDVLAPTGTFQSDTKPLNSDEWARFLNEKGVPAPSGQSSTFQTISTYTIDVYNEKGNAAQSGLLAGMARAGGGKYFAANNQAAIVTALNSIFSEIQAVNSTFASAALPISSTNRSQNNNEVYLGMFRPDPTAHPRWFGNLKRYKLGVFSGSTDLADSTGAQAASGTTGFITPCAVSFWTTSSGGSYWYDTTNDLNRIFITDAATAGTAWQPAGNNSKYAKGGCNDTSNGGIYDDKPDGANVEKGGAAQMLRNLSSRNIKTLSGSSLVAFNTTNVTGISADSTVNANIVNFIRGEDVTGEISGAASTAKRPSIHGDVIHSKPQPVDYGGSTGTIVFYGAGDGAYRAIKGSTGEELWSFVAPESYSGLQRLLDNTPLIQTPSPTPPGGTAVAGATPKEFFFDGSSGLYQNQDSSKVWIFPSMRRGGRMLYAFDVSNPAAPIFKWKVGCPNQGNDTGCTSGFTGIGQTWSTPTVGFVPGFSDTTPVVVVGGGYDTCEDADTASVSCSSPKGAVVYVLNADTGALIKSYATGGKSIASDPTLVDINLDGTLDAAYVADTGGNIYRLDFSSTSGYATLNKEQWTLRKVAYTNGGSRKFLFQPAVLPYKGSVYMAIASGDREHPLSVSYPYTSPVTNRFYIYLDDPARTTATDLDGSGMTNYSDASLVNCSSAKILPGGATTGWYMDLTANGVGEQGVTSALIIGGMASFSTNRPLASASSCTNPLGEARGYWVNLLNSSGAINVSGTCGGVRSNTFIGGGLPPSPVVGVVTIDGTPQAIVLGSAQRNSTAPSSSLSGQQVRPPISGKRNRIYWRTDADTR